MNLTVIFDFFQMIADLIQSINQGITSELILLWGEYYSPAEIQQLELKVYISMGILFLTFSYSFYIMMLDLVNQVNQILSKLLKYKH